MKNTIGIGELRPVVRTRGSGLIRAGQRITALLLLCTLAGPSVAQVEPGSAYAAATSSQTPTATWQFVTIPGLPAGATLGKIWARTRNEAYVWATTGAATSAPEAILFRWDGATWSQVLDVRGYSGGSVFGVGSAEVFADVSVSGMSPQMYRSTDNGLSGSFVKQDLPPEAEGALSLNDISGTVNNVFALLRTQVGPDNGYIIRFNGTSWSVVFTPTNDNMPFVLTVPFLSPTEGYYVGCWGWGRWDGTQWLFSGRQFDFCDIYGTWAMRDSSGALQWYAVGNNNFSNGVRVWKFDESTQSFGSKFGYIFSDGSGGSARGIWGSAPDDVYVIGALYATVGGSFVGSHVYHYDGAAWSDVTPFTLTSDTGGITGTAPDDVWVSLAHSDVGLTDGLLHFTSQPRANCVLPPSHLIAWWPGEVNYNDIVGTNDGTPANNVASAPGEVGAAFSLNEPGPVDPYNCPACAYIAITNNLPTSADAVTVAAWVYPDQSQQSQGSIEWVYTQFDEASCGSIGSCGPQLGIVGTDTILWRPNGDDEANLNSPGIVPSNTWTFLVGTYDAATGLSQIYVNGKLVQTETYSGSVPLSNTPFIGKRIDPSRGSGQEFWVGRIDELQLFARALSVQEIQTIYDAGTAGECQSSPGPVIEIGTAAGAPGRQVQFPVTLKTNGAVVAGVQNQITFDSHAPIAAGSSGSPDCTVNQNINKGDTTFAFQPKGCMPGSTCTAVEVLVVSFDNANPITDGSVLYTCRVSIAANAQLGQRYPLACSAPDASDPNGHATSAVCTDGAIAVGIPQCSGDCNGDGKVTIDEIITMVNIALGSANVSACLAGDANGDGQITVDELVAAVNNALNGCS